MNSLQLRIHVEEDEPNDFVIGTLAAIDGVPVVEDSTFAVSLYRLRESLRGSGEYFIITCGCGVPRCADIGRGVAVAYDHGVVSWAINEPAPSRRFSFEESAYRLEIGQAIERFREAYQELHRPPDRYASFTPAMFEEPLISDIDAAG
jgi:hypothetical protein